MLNNDSSSLVRFSNFFEDIRQTNCGVTLGIDRPMMLKWNSRHMTSFAIKQDTIYFEVIFAQTTIVGFEPGSKTHTMDCCFLSGSYAQIHDSSAVMIL